MDRTLLLVGLLPILAYGADECAAPPDALAKLKAYLSYETRGRLWGPGTKRFSLAEADGTALFLQYEVPKYYDETQGFVYAFRKGSRLLVAGCPNNPQWTKCAENDFREFIHQPPRTPERPIGPTCDLSITVPEWRPSPDSPLKRRLASEVLQELMEYGYTNPREVYVRDFNVGDPELDVYIVDQDGKGNLQGCTFDADFHPHCAWHFYGQSPVEELKWEIMARPYRLFPPETPPDLPGR